MVFSLSSPSSNLASTSYSAHSIGIVSKKAPALDILQAIEEELRGMEGGRGEEFRTTSRQVLTLVAQSSESLLACSMNQLPIEYLAQKTVSTHDAILLVTRITHPVS